MRAGIITIACVNDKETKYKLFKRISKFADFIKSRNDINFSNLYIVILIVDGKLDLVSKIAGDLGNIKGVKVSTILTKEIKEVRL